MSDNSLVASKLEYLLERGTWISTAVVAVGVIFSLELITKIGIAMFILIPIGRIIGLLISFIKEKDKHMALIATFVLGIILLSLTVGVVTSKVH
jgi:uncharacterized membrane protein